MYKKFVLVAFTISFRMNTLYVSAECVRNIMVPSPLGKDFIEPAPSVLSLVYMRKRFISFKSLKYLIYLISYNIGSVWEYYCKGKNWNKRENNGRSIKI
jgi:hypothetical protein